MTTLRWVHKAAFQAAKVASRGDEALKLLIGTLQVTNPARTSVPASGTECCVVLG